MKVTDSRSEFLQALQKLKNAGIGEAPVRPICHNPDADIMRQLSRVLHPKEKKIQGMLFFVMYDISDNKVRNLVVKYLQKKGCVRIQKSIFLANLTPATFSIIHSDLKAVQSCYENDDSIMMVPVPTDFLNSMKIIGKEVNTDLIIGKTDILFF